MAAGVQMEQTLWLRGGVGKGVLRQIHGDGGALQSEASGGIQMVS